jgi:DNA polymerase-3 subunit alpha
VLSQFVHLRVKTDLSLSEGLLSVGQAVDLAKKSEMPAIAVADLCRTSGLVQLHKSAKKNGIKPITSVEVFVRTPEISSSITRLVLIARSAQGYTQMNRLLSKAYAERAGAHDQPIIEMDWLTPESCSDLIALSGFDKGAVGIALANGDDALANDLAIKLSRAFPENFFLELQRDGSDEFERMTTQMCSIANELRLPVVATHPILFEQASDFTAHEAKHCIIEQKYLVESAKNSKFRPEHYFKTSAEMIDAFKDIPSAISNTLTIAMKANHSVEFGKSVLPAFPCPDGLDEKQYLTNMANEGLERRLITLYPDEAARERAQASYKSRLDTEIATILEMGFAGYFLIVQDFVNWSKRNGVPVGPGRGSGAGSLVAYSLGITDVDPLRYDLLFERFLNPERVSMPDFDIDFCRDGRGRTINYVREFYGAQRSTQIATFGALKAKGVSRDVARVMQLGRGQTLDLINVLPSDSEVSLEDHADQNASFASLMESSDEFRSFFDVAKRLSGKTRLVSAHAGGVVISPAEMNEYSAVVSDRAGQTPVTVMFDKDDTEALGLVKFDLLGLKNLTVIAQALKSINAQREQYGQTQMTEADIPASDPAVFDLFAQGRTTGVFQSESSGAKSLEKSLKPTTFEDIVALMALNRPGPLQSGMVDDFIARKTHVQASGGPDPQWYFHPDLEPVLKSTYGVMVYQEQVMLVAQVLAGYSLGGADLLRRAMGKKKPEEMAQQREIFKAGAMDRGVSEALATKLFDLMEKFSEYGFNKSHSVAYAQLAYQTAWLKAHYPCEYMAALLSVDCSDTARVRVFVDDAKLNCFIPSKTGPKRVVVLPPCVNSSEYEFIATYDEAGQPTGILYGLGAIKGVGQAVCDHISQERMLDGGYLSFEDFVFRNATVLRKNTLLAIIKSGACDSLGLDRAMMMSNAEHVLAWASKLAKNKSVDLFGMQEGPKFTAWLEPKPVDHAQLIADEKEAMGFNLQHNPLSGIEARLGAAVDTRLGELEAGLSSVWVGGVLSNVKIRPTKRGDMAFGTLSDNTGEISVVLYSESLEKFKPLIGNDALIAIKGKPENDSYTEGLKIVVQDAMDLTARLDAAGVAAPSVAETVRSTALTLQLDLGENPDLPLFWRGLNRYVGEQNSTDVILRYSLNGQEIIEPLEPTHRVEPTEQLLAGLRKFLGPNAVSLSSSPIQSEVSRPETNACVTPGVWYDARHIMEDQLDSNEVRKLSGHKVRFNTDTAQYEHEIDGQVAHQYEAWEDALRALRIAAGQNLGVCESGLRSAAHAQVACAS